MVWWRCFRFVASRRIINPDLVFGSSAGTIVIDIVTIGVGGGGRRRSYICGDFNAREEKPIVILCM